MVESCPKTACQSFLAGLLQGWRHACGFIGKEPMPYVMLGLLSGSVVSSALSTWHEGGLFLIHPATWTSAAWW